MTHASKLGAVLRPGGWKRTFNFQLSTLNGNTGVILKIEVINTGSELMLGRVLNTHQQWICRRLADQGYVVTRQIAVGDTGRDIQQAVRESLARARLVIVLAQDEARESLDITRKQVRAEVMLIVGEGDEAARGQSVPRRSPGGLADSVARPAARTAADVQRAGHSADPAKVSTRERLRLPHTQDDRFG